MVRFVHHIAHTVKPKDVISHRAGAATFNLVLVAKEPLSREPPAIVQLAVGQHAQQGGLSGVHIAHDGDPHLGEIVLLYLPPDEVLPGIALLRLSSTQRNTVRAKHSCQGFQRCHGRSIIIRHETIFASICGGDRNMIHTTLNRVCFVTCVCGCVWVFV